MTIFNIITNLEAVAKCEPNVNFTGNGDIYDLNELPNLDYSIFFITQNSHTMDNERNTINYSLNLYYVDRLLEDDKNGLTVQSNGIQILTNIINRFISENYDDVEIDGEITFESFIHKFKDLCSGVYATITFSTPNDIGRCDY